MNQLSASAFRRITFRSKGGVYSGIFTSDAGDLYQEYDGSPTNPTKCYPDWSQPGNKQAMYLEISRLAINQCRHSCICGVFCRRNYIDVRHRESGTMYYSRVYKSFPD